MPSGHDNAGVWGYPDEMHFIKTASRMGVLSAHWLAKFCKYDLKSVAEAAQAAMDVWHWPRFSLATQSAAGHLTGCERSAQYKAFKRMVCCCR
jgi:hypothetical protein